MSSEPQFKVNDLVFAKMKSYPYWPARVEELPADSKSTKYKIFFFGTYNFAIVDLTGLKPYKEFKDSLSKQCKLKSFYKALEDIESKPDIKVEQIVEEETHSGKENETSNKQQQSAKRRSYVPRKSDSIHKQQGFRRRSYIPIASTAQENKTGHVRQRSAGSPSLKHIASNDIPDLKRLIKRKSQVIDLDMPETISLLAKNSNENDFRSEAIKHHSSPAKLKKEEEEDEENEDIPFPMDEESEDLETTSEVQEKHLEKETLMMVFLTRKEVEDMAKTLKVTANVQKKLQKILKKK